MIDEVLFKRFYDQAKKEQQENPQKIKGTDKDWPFLWYLDSVIDNYFDMHDDYTMYARSCDMEKYE